MMIDKKKNSDNIERNNKNVWYLIGTEYFKSIGGEGRLQPIHISDYDIPNQISHACYVPVSEHIYYSTKDSPQRIQGRYLGINNNSNTEIRNLQLNASKNLRIAEIKRGDIIAIDSSISHIFVLSREKEKGEDNYTYYLYKYEVSVTGGAAIVHSSIVNFSGLITDHNKEFHLSVVERGRWNRHRVYFSGSSFSSPSYYNFITHQAEIIIPSPIIFKNVFNFTPNFEQLLALCNKGKSKQKPNDKHEVLVEWDSDDPVAMIGIESETKDIYQIYHTKESELKLSKISIPNDIKNDFNLKILSAVEIEMVFPNILEEGYKIRQLGLVYDDKRRKIYAFTIDGKNNFYNLIGGGSLILFNEIHSKEYEKYRHEIYNKNSDPTNLLNTKIGMHFYNYSIPAIDEIIPLPLSGLMLGSKMSNQWFILLCPKSWYIGTQKDEKHCNNSDIPDDISGS